MRLTIEFSGDAASPQVTVHTPDDVQATADAPVYDGGADRMDSLESPSPGTSADVTVAGDGMFDGGQAPTGRPDRFVEPPVQIERSHRINCGSPR